MTNLFVNHLNYEFQPCIKHGKFPNEWKMANVVPVHKKSDQQILYNYWPVSLLPICVKVFERLIYNSLFEYFIESYLISPNQSGFKPDDLCTNQLISITHEIYHLGMLLDLKLDFEEHLKNIYSKVNKIGLLCKLHNTLPRLSLLTIYKSFIRPNLDYGDVIYHQVYVVSFNQKRESVQYN